MTVNDVLMSVFGLRVHDVAIWNNATVNVSMFFGFLMSYGSTAIWKDGNDVSMSMVWRVYDTAIWKDVTVNDVSMFFGLTSLR